MYLNEIILNLMVAQPNQGFHYFTNHGVGDSEEIVA